MRTPILPVLLALLAALACGQPPEPPSPLSGVGWWPAGRSGYISFLEVDDADSYLIMYRPAGTVEWSLKEVEQTGYGRQEVLLFDLTPDTYFEVQVASRKEGAPDSEFTRPRMFKTNP